MQQEPARAMRIRTALVTARSAPAHERAIRTLMDWRIEVDEAMFPRRLAKGAFLREFNPTSLRRPDRPHRECRRARPRGHVAAGVSND